MTDESAINARRVQPSAFDDDAWIYRNEGRPLRDEPIDTPESVGRLMVALQAFCLVLALVIVLAVIPLLTPYWPRVVAFFAGVM